MIISDYAHNAGLVWADEFMCILFVVKPTQLSPSPIEVLMNLGLHRKYPYDWCLTGMTGKYTWLVVWLPFFIFPLILGMSSSQWTNSYFSEGWVYNHQPDTIIIMLNGWMVFPGMVATLWWFLTATTGACRGLPGALEIWDDFEMVLGSFLIWTWNIMKWG